MKLKEEKTAQKFTPMVFTITIETVDELKRFFDMLGRTPSTKSVQDIYDNLKKKFNL